MFISEKCSLFYLLHLRFGTTLSNIKVFTVIFNLNHNATGSELKVLIDVFVVIFQF